MVKLFFKINLIAITLGVISCSTLHGVKNFTFREGDYTYHPDQFRIDGYYIGKDTTWELGIKGDSVEILEVFFIGAVFFRNGYVFSRSGTSKENLLIDFDQIRKIEEQNIDFYNCKNCWGRYKVLKDELYIQIFGASSPYSYHALDIRGQILNDTTVYFRNYEDTDGSLVGLNDVYHFVHSAIKPDSVNWVMKHKRLNN